MSCYWRLRDRLDDFDDNPYLRRSPVRGLLGSRLRTYNPLSDDNDWLRPGPLSRRSIYPLSRRLRLGPRDDDDDWLSRSVGRGRMAARRLRRGFSLNDDNDDWYSSVMNRGRRLARGGLFGRFRDDDDNNMWRSPLMRNRGLLRSRRLLGPLSRDDDDDNLFRSPLLRNRGSLRPRSLYNPLNRDNDDYDWMRPGRIGARTRSLLRRDDDDDNRYENIFGRQALRNSLQGLPALSSPFQLDDDWWKSSQNRNLNPIRNFFPALQNDDDDDNNFNTGLQSLYQPRSLFNNDNGLSRNTVRIV